MVWRKTNCWKVKKKIVAKTTIYMGHYGSGKTELSISKAFLLTDEGYSVTLVDLDIVNPYFRSGEQKEVLESKGIRVIMPNFEGTNVAVPSLPGEINSVFDKEDICSVFDVGGSPSGAAAIGRYSAKIKENDYEAILVVNALRPFTTTTEDIVLMAQQIEHKSRLKITSVINNTNVAYDTTADMVEHAQNIIESAAQALNAKVTEIRALPSVIDEMSKKFIDKYQHIIKPISLYMRPDWIDSI